MPEVQANGVSISYNVSGQGSPVLFIHGGFGGPSTSLMPRARTMGTILPEDRVQTIEYDRRGTGQSEYVPSEYTLPDLAADARALLEHLEIDRSVVIGDSMGGMVALQYALSYSRHVVGLALVETGPALMSATPWGGHLQEVVKQAKAEGDRAAFDSNIDEIRNPSPLDMGARSPEAARRLQNSREAMEASLAKLSDGDLFRYTVGAFRNYGAFVGYDFSLRLSQLKMPVSIIHGNSDPTVPLANGLALFDGIPHAEFCEIEDGTHGILDFTDAAWALREWVLRIVGD